SGAGEVEAADGLHEPDREPTDDGAPYAAKPAEHDDHEGQDGELLAGARREREERQDQSAGRTDGRRAEPEGESEDSAYVHADHLGALRVGGDGTDRESQPGTAQHDGEGDGDDDGTDKGDDPRHRRDGAEDAKVTADRRLDGLLQ